MNSTVHGKEFIQAGRTIQEKISATNKVQIQVFDQGFSTVERDLRRY